MKKILLLLPVMMLVAASCSSSQQASVAVPTQTPVVTQNANSVPSTTPTPSAATTLQPTPTISSNPTQNSLVGYNNQQYGFAFSYAKNFALSEDQNQISGQGGYMSFYSGTPVALVDVEVPRSLYPSTSDFGGASFTVFTDPGISQQDCSKVSIPGLAYNGSDTSVQINGINFEHNERVGAAAGTDTDMRYYLTYHNNLCFGIMEAVSTSSGAEDITSHINYTDVFPQLDPILNSFKFSN